MTPGGESGLFVTFEGVEGCGKSTQLARAAVRMREAGSRVTATREPGGTELGRTLRTALLRPTETPMHPLSELMLYAADRAEHLHRVILPALSRGEVVLCDRYLDATLAYQGYGRELGLEIVLELHRRPPLDLRPARTILLDLDVRSGLARARERDRGGAAASQGRFEAEEIEFHERVREGYLELARTAPERFVVVDATGAVDAVERLVWPALAELLKP